LPAAAAGRASERSCRWVGWGGTQGVGLYLHREIQFSQAGQPCCLPGNCQLFTLLQLSQKVLVPDLLARIHGEWLEHRRRPHTLTVKWRHKGAGWQRCSASAPLPLSGPLATAPGAREIGAVTKAALQLLRQQLRSGFDLSLINVGATNLKDEDAPGSYDTRAFDRLLAVSGSSGRGGGRGGGSSGGSGGTQTAAKAAASADAPPSAPAAQPVGSGAPEAALPAWARDLASSSASPAARPSTQLPPQLQGGVGGPNPSLTAAAAAAQRRDYRKSPGKGAALIGMSKSEERRLREQAILDLAQPQGPRRAAGSPDRDAQPPAAKLQRTAGEAARSAQPAQAAAKAAAGGAIDLFSFGGGGMGLVEVIEDAEWTDSEG